MRETITINASPEERRAIAAFAEQVAGGEASRASLEAGALRLQAMDQGVPPSELAMDSLGAPILSYVRPTRRYGQLGTRPQCYAHSSARQFSRNGARAFAQPDLTDVHVDRPLTNISVAYFNTSYIGPLLFPRVPVVNQSDKYFTYSQSPWTRNEARVRGVSAQAAASGYAVDSTSTYRVDEHAFEHPIDDRIRSNSDSPLAPDADAAMYTADKLDLALEVQVANLAFTAANWSSTVALAGATQWSDYNNSTPFSDLKTARLAVLKIGRPANTLAMGVEVFEALALHPDLLDRVKYTGTQDRPAMVTAEMMAALFRVDRVLIGQGVVDTSSEGDTANIQFIWGKTVFFGYVSPAPALYRPSAGYVFTTGRIVDRRREEAITSDVIRARESWDTKAVAAGAGYTLTTAVA